MTKPQPTTHGRKTNNCIYNCINAEEPGHSPRLNLLSLIILLSYQHLFDNLSQCFESFLVLLCKSSDKRTVYVQDSVKFAVEMKRNYYL